MIDFLTFLITESACAIWHNALTLRGTDLGAQVCLCRLTKDARRFAALRCVTRNDVIARDDTSNSRPDRFHDTPSLMTKDAGKNTLWILTIQCEDISMTQGIGDHFDPNFSRSRWIHSNRFEDKRFTRLSCHHSFALDWIALRRRKVIGRVCGS